MKVKQSISKKRHVKKSLGDFLVRRNGVLQRRNKLDPNRNWTQRKRKKKQQ